MQKLCLRQIILAIKTGDKYGDKKKSAETARWQANKSETE